jgi:peptidoglycan/LPS O-acetylase OafA/YrhL
LHHLPALDGLRALAIIAVMLYHFRTKPLIPGGGIVGVDLFFVLSGFLITTLLLQEWSGTGRISLRRFYQRRALRLIPALLLFVAVYLSITLGFRGHDFTGQPSSELILRNVGAVATYTMNWVNAYGGMTIPGFSHLWSLSIEEQFYVFWPLALVLLLRLRLPAVGLLAISLAVILVSALLPYLGDQPRNRLYFGTDFRLQTLLLGAVLAQLYVSGMLQAPTIRHSAFRVVLAGSLLFLVAAALLTSNRTTFLFFGGHSAVAICSGVLIVGCMFRQRTLLTGVLSHPVLVYIGKRSYALYIWHLAIGSWLRSLDDAPQVVLAFALSFLAAELSYRLVEAPALRLKSRLGKPQPEATRAAIAPIPEPNPGVAA